MPLCEVHGHPEQNAGNLNVPRYIQKIDDTLPQNIAAHLKGGIPGTDIESLKRLWDISPALKQEIFTCVDEAHDVYNPLSRPARLRA